jgi:hypothetical protein
MFNQESSVKRVGDANFIECPSVQVAYCSQTDNRVCSRGTKKRT